MAALGQQNDRFGSICLQNCTRRLSRYGRFVPVSDPIDYRPENATRERLINVLIATP
jgi:hypothetical protein